VNSLILLCFGIVVALGITTAVIGGRRGRPAATIAHVHGLAATAALGLLVYRVITGPENLWFNTALFLFLLTFVGGLFMLLVRRSGEPPFMALIVLHASFAIVAFLTLLGGVSGP